MELVNLTLYQPSGSVDCVLYLRDETGLDWYESQAKFADDTLKICVDGKQVIIAASRDVSTLWPVNVSVFEVTSDTIPEGFETNGKWGWNDKAIVSLVTTDSQRQNKIEEIKSYRDKITADYIIIEAHHFHSDADSRIQQMTLTKMGQAQQIPTGLMWQTKNHGLITLTNEIAAQFETVTMTHDMRLFATAQQHIKAVEALDNVQAIEDYDYSSGWQP